MQHFLISPSVGGAIFTKAALEFIIKETEIIPPIGFIESDGIVYSMYDSEKFPERLPTACPLYSEWWHIYTSQYPGSVFSELEGSNYIDIPPHSDFRDLIVLHILPSGYTYRNADFFKKLDEANNGTELRIVDVPDGYHCFIVADPEYDCESVQELGRTWVPMTDERMLTKQLFIKFSHDFSTGGGTLEGYNTEGTPFKYEDLVIAIQGEHGAVYSKISNEMFFIRMSTYFCETADHPKEWFEIVGETYGKLQTWPAFHDIETVKSYVSLAEAVMKEVKVENGRPEET